MLHVPSFYQLYLAFRVFTVGGIKNGKKYTTTQKVEGSKQQMDIR